MIAVDVTPAPFVIAVLILALGVLGVAFAILRRVHRSGEGEATGHRNIRQGEPNLPVLIATTIAVVVGLLVLLLSRRAAAQGPAPRSAAILVIRENDTLAVQRVRRNERTVVSSVAGRGQPTIELLYRLGEGHAIPEVDFVVRGPGAAPDAPALQSGTVRFAGDSAHLEVRVGAAAPRPMHLATRAGALPSVNNDLVAFEQMVRMARARGVPTLTVPLFALSGGQTIDAKVDLVADSARFTLGASVIEAALDAHGNITGGAIPAARLRLVVVTGDAMERVALGKPDYGAPANAPYTAEEVVVRTPAGHALSGTLTRPRGTGRVPAVVTITGSGHQDRDEYLPVAGGWRLFRQVADTLGRRGIAVLRLDDRSVGGSGGDPAGTSADFADDIRAAVSWLRSRADIDPDRIGLVGHSEGGLIAPMVARTDARLAAVVLMAGPAYTGRAIIAYQMENGLRAVPGMSAAARDSALRAQTAEFDSTEARRPWMRFFLDYDPLPTARAVRQPVLILQGATDQQVRAEEARMLERALREGGNRAVTLQVLADRNHLFLRDPDGHPSGYGRLADPRVDDEVMGALADWLAMTLRVR